MLRLHNLPNIAIVSWWQNRDAKTGKQFPPFLSEIQGHLFCISCRYASFPGTATVDGCFSDLIVNSTPFHFLEVFIIHLLHFPPKWLLDLSYPFYFCCLSLIYTVITDYIDGYNKILFFLFSGLFSLLCISIQL